MKTAQKVCATLLSCGLLAASASGCSLFGGGGSGSGTLGESPITSMTLIGVAMPGEAGTQDDGERLEALLKDEGYSVELAYAAGDSDTQLRQLDAMLQDECALLIVDAVDAAAMEAYLAATTADVTVVAYETYLDSGSVACYLGTDYAAMGRAQAEYLLEALELDAEDAEADRVYTLEAAAGETAADALIYQGAMEVLSPYVESGRLTIRSGAAAYDAVKTGDANAYMDGILSRYYADGTELDAVLTTSDETADGALTAISNSYTGSVFPLVTSALCGLASAQWLSDGFLCMTTLEPEQDLVEQAVQTVGQLRKGGTEDVLTEGSIVTPDNFQERLIATGIYAISNTGVVSYGTGEDGSATYDTVDTSGVDTVDVEGHGDTDPAAEGGA